MQSTMKSPISVLQEYCQQNSIDMPVYTCEGNGKSHQPVFRATCTVGMQTFEGTNCNTKKAAEHSAAAIAFEKLSIKDIQSISQKHVLSTEERTKQCNMILLVDWDNFDIPIDIVKNSTARFMMYCARNGTKSPLLYKGCSNVETFSAPSIGKSATDIYMTYEARSIRDRNPNANIAVVTRDHFGYHLAHIMNATYCCSIQEIVKWLQA